MFSKGQRGEKWEKAGNWTQGEKRGRVSRVLSASLPLLAQEDPSMCDARRVLCAAGGWGLLAPEHPRRVGVLIGPWARHSRA
eukprot:9504023-Pyramimonas_sp.AAC.2